jgi:type VI secretion system protein ImpH
MTPSSVRIFENAQNHFECAAAGRSLSFMPPQAFHSRSPLARLFSTPAKFDFFQAVRLLERLAARKGRTAIGGDTAPEQEAVYCRILPALRFAEGPVSRTLAGTEDDPPELWATFFGLTGPDGILPQHYTALILARQKIKDHTLRDWLDLFHHRVLSLLMRAWEKNRWPAQVDRRLTEESPAPRALPGGDRSVRPAREDPCTNAALSIAGFGTSRLRGRLGLPDEVAVYYAGLLSRQPRTATGLEQVVSDYFGWPVAIEQLCGQWLYLDDPNKAGMPTETTPGRNTCLGRDVVIGRRVWDVQGKVRVVIGPVNAEGFRSLLPDGAARRPLSAMIRLYLGLELDVEVQVVLAPNAVPWAAMEYDELNGPRLGWNSWVRTHNFGRPIGDVRFTVD